jgi:hypothetical protein
MSIILVKVIDRNLGIGKLSFASSMETTISCKYLTSRVIAL